MIATLPLVLASFHDWLERWAPLADWGVAIGTALLAFATFVLARSARDEASAVRDEARRVALQAEAALRAYVYPEAIADWAQDRDIWAGRRNDSLPLRNGGPGLALNVKGKVGWPGREGQGRDLYGGSIASGQSAVGRLAFPADAGWNGAVGHLRYSDLNGDDWETHFTITHGEGGQDVVDHDAPARA